MATSDLSEHAGPTVPSATRVALLLGTLIAMTVIGSSAVAVALPIVAREIDLDSAGRAWVLASFSLTFSIATAVFGRVADRHGLRRPLLIGVGLLASGSLAAAASVSFPTILVARLVQGFGAGAVPVMAMGIIAARFDESRRGAVLGGLTAVVSIVSGSGPLIGGLTAELLSWRAVLGLPVLALLLLRPIARLAPDAGAAAGHLDLRGAVLVGAAVTGLTLLLQAPATGGGWLAAGAALLLAVSAGAVLARHVRRRPHGFLPLAVVRNPRVVASAFAALTLLAAYLGTLVAVPDILESEQAWTPLQIGLALLPAAAVGALTSRVVGGVAHRVGRYRVAAALALGSTAGLVLSSVAHDQPLLLVGGMAPVFAGFAGGQVALLDGIPPLVAPEVRGVAIGVFNLVFFTGGAIGAATVGGLSGLVGVPGALACLALLPALGALAALRAGRPA